MTRPSDASNEWGICPFDFIGKIAILWHAERHAKYMPNEVLPKANWAPSTRRIT